LSRGDGGPCWNFPFAIATWKLAPALGFGNAVVCKPAEAASVSAVLLTQVLSDGGLPAGVEPHVPLGGLKGSSSMNREQGKAARLFFTTTKTVYLRSS